ncbi:ATP-binding cassette domain-containing protein [Peribacillus sp. SI8-4]|uniref:ATP-binding cassette domain-containing protein n=1 Tax=Peribacillus sp. SI8-4 TaxID=3048009 RepID=UPI002555043E|nr:ATP-binding cassette domain-containing protein [Peribacillus sp. SI8-4]
MLSITDLEKSYSAKKILNGVNLEIKKGETLGFIGANGAGKTTTLNIITGILDSENGKVEINGLTKDEWFQGQSVNYIG